MANVVTKQDIQRLYNLRVPVKDIAEHFKIHPRTVYNHVAPKNPRPKPRSIIVDANKIKKQKQILEKNDIKTTVADTKNAQSSQRNSTTVNTKQTYKPVNNSVPSSETQILNDLSRRDKQYGLVE